MICSRFVNEYSKSSVDLIELYLSNNSFSADSKKLLKSNYSILELCGVLLIFRKCWGDWDSVSCYACGLMGIDPESDEEVSNNFHPWTKLFSNYYYRITMRALNTYL